MTAVLPDVHPDLDHKTVVPCYVSTVAPTVPPLPCDEVARLLALHRETGWTPLCTTCCNRWMSFGAVVEVVIL